MIANPLSLILVICLLCLAKPDAAAKGRQGTGLPLPRYVSLRAATVNMRAGPSVRYPVEWVYRRSGLPVEVIAEFDTWRKVRDWEGSQGWIHQSMLSGRRMFIVVNGPFTIRRDHDLAAVPVAQIESRVIGRLLGCPADVTWCRVDVNGYQGWMPRQGIWGVYGAEAVE